MLVAGNHGTTTTAPVLVYESEDEEEWIGEGGSVCTLLTFCTLLHLLDLLDLCVYHAQVPGGMSNCRGSRFARDADAA
jgi:hypothetical protein